MNEKEYILVSAQTSDEASDILDSINSGETEQSADGSETGVQLTPGNRENILNALDITWKGLVAIFIVIAIIIAVVSLVNLCIGKAEHAKKLRDNPELAEAERAEKEEKARLKAEKRAAKDAGTGNGDGKNE